MSLPNDVARCDGLLPKLTRGGQLIWGIDCPQRETCARYNQMERDDPAAPPGTYRYTGHHHAPGVSCFEYMEEKTDE